MSKFEPKAIKKASLYLQEKLSLFKKSEIKDDEKNIYIVEDKKESIFRRFINSIFE